jgi:hypothetical protein
MPVKSSGVLLERGARKLGLHPQVAPVAILSQPFNGRPACIHCGFCMGFGCEMAAKSSTLVTMIPQAEATGRCEIRPQSTVHRLETGADGRISEVLGHADRLLAAVRAAAPQAALAVGLTTPPNARESGFEASYKGRYLRWNWKRIQHRLVERMLAHHGGREAEDLHLVATHLHLDPLAGYPVDNGVHPNPAGYAQIGASFHGWLRCRLAAGWPGDR